MNIGAGEFAIIFMLFVAPLALVFPIWALVDITGRPPAVWDAAGKSRTFWLVAMIVSLFMLLGWLLAIVYLVSVRPRLDAVADRGRTPASAD